MIMKWCSEIIWKRIKFIEKTENEKRGEHTEGKIVKSMETTTMETSNTNEVVVCVDGLDEIATLHAL